jgi:hypothetical protein
MKRNKRPLSLAINPNILLHRGLLPYDYCLHLAMHTEPIKLLAEKLKWSSKSVINSFPQEHSM